MKILRIFTLYALLSIGETYSLKILSRIHNERPMSINKILEKNIFRLKKPNEKRRAKIFESPAAFHTHLNRQHRLHRIRRKHHQKRITRKDHPKR